MIIPLSVLLIPFSLLAAGVALMGALKSRQLFTYGSSFGAFLATAIFWGGYAFVLLAAWSMLAAVDWATPLVDLGIFLSPSL